MHAVICLCVSALMLVLSIVCRVDIVCMRVLLFSTRIDYIILVGLLGDFSYCFNTY